MFVTDKMDGVTTTTCKRSGDATGDQMLGIYRAGHVMVCSEMKNKNGGCEEGMVQQHND